MTRCQQVYKAQLVRMAFEKAENAGLWVWSLTADGTLLNILQLSCIFWTTYDAMVTKFKHPSEDYYVLNMVHIPYVESSHAWKLLQCSHSLLTDNNGGEITLGRLSQSTRYSRTDVGKQGVGTNSPFKYLLTYKYSQDHIELLFSCIRPRGG